MRWGLGPVFIYECLTNSRRWQGYALRAFGVAALLTAMSLVATAGPSRPMSTWRDYASLGEGYFVAMIGVELALVILAAPAATAGAICVDRARGTLAHMLMTDLSDAEIVLGKLAARLLPVFGLVACTWPVMAISSLLGGIDPIALSLAFAIILAVAVLGCTTALAISVWARKSHEVILATYTLFIVGLLFWPVWYLCSLTGKISPPPPWTLLANPFYVAFAPYADPGKLGLWDYLAFFGTILAATAFFTGLAVWRTRPVACRDSGEKPTGPRVGLLGRIRRLIPGPSLDQNPVFWRECHRARPSRWMTAILILLMGTTGVLCLTGGAAFWKNGASFGPGTGAWEIAGVCSYVLHVIFGLLLLSAIAPTSMAEERQRGSLDLLAATTLSSRAIVFGKWLGTFRLALLIAICPAYIALAMATAHVDPPNFGPASGLPPDFYKVITLPARICGVFVVIATILAHGALITSIGVAMAVWMKRQSRAIAISVGAFVLIIAVWPFVIGLTVRAGPDFGRGLATLSPAVACGLFIPFLTTRYYGNVGDILPSSTFWALEVFIVAMGLFWLTVRSFDHCFDRMPDRPRRLSLLAVVVMILAGMIGAGSLTWAVESWAVGVKPVQMNGSTLAGIFPYVLAIALGLVLAAVDAARSGRRARTSLSEFTAALGARNFVLRRWWISFGLILVLAIGPGLFSLALATAPKQPRYESKVTTNANRTRSVTYTLVKDDDSSAGELRVGQRFLIAGVLIATILAHGAAAIGIGLGLTTMKGWSKWMIAAAVAGTTLVVLILPLYLFVLYGSQGEGTGSWSFVTAASSLLALLASRIGFNLGDTLWPVVYWDVAAVLFGAALSWRTICIMRDDLRDKAKAQPALATEF